MNEASSLAPQARRLAEFVGELAELPAMVDDDVARIDVIAGLERLRAAVAAAQVRVVEAFAVSQEAANRGLGFEARVARRGIPEQVGLARRVSPASASRQVSQARALVRDLPRTLGLLQAGQISELVATLVVNETSVLSAADRRIADERIAARLPGLGPKQALATARRTVIELDQQAVVARAAKARKDRRVSCRPAPDTMAVLSALLPCEDGVRAYAALRAHADSRKAAGDERSRDQIMADTLVERLTGHAPATGGPVEIGLIMTDQTLFDGEADTPAEMNGYGPIPGPLARNIIGRATDADATTDTAAQAATDTAAAAAEAARVFLRRLFTDPVTGTVAQVDPRRRRFTGTLAALLLHRDRYCRTPFCEAPIRHLDHIRPHATGGPTTATNGRGLCERCNYINQLPGWTARLIDWASPRSVETSPQ
jgi:hypothetical protein